MTFLLFVQNAIVVIATLLAIYNYQKLFGKPVAVLKDIFQIEKIQVVGLRKFTEAIIGASLFTTFLTVVSASCLLPLSFLNVLFLLGVSTLYVLSYQVK